MRFITALRVFAYCCVAVPASAQATFANVRPEGLPTVFVTDRAGQVTKGQLVGLTDAAIVVKTDLLTRTFAPADVGVIERKGDSLKNGTLIGLAAGLLFAGTMVTSDCPRHNCAGARLAFGLPMIGLYTAIGTAIDAAIPGRTRIWPGRTR